MHGCKLLHRHQSIRCPTAKGTALVELWAGVVTVPKPLQTKTLTLLHQHTDHQILSPVGAGLTESLRDKHNRAQHAPYTTAMGYRQPCLCLLHSLTVRLPGHLTACCSCRAGGGRVSLGVQHNPQLAPAVTLCVHSCTQAQMHTSVTDSTRGSERHTPQTHTCIQAT
jgi:hypothetical protein